MTTATHPILTPRQREVWQFVADRHTRGLSTSYREIANHDGVRIQATIHVVNSLLRKGFLRRQIPGSDRHSRSRTLVPVLLPTPVSNLVKIRLLGSNNADPITVDGWLGNHPTLPGVWVVNELATG